MNSRFNASKKSSSTKLNQFQFNLETISKHFQVVNVSRLQARKISKDKNFFNVQNQI